MIKVLPALSVVNSKQTLVQNIAFGFVEPHEVRTCPLPKLHELDLCAPFCPAMLHLSLVMTYDDFFFF